MGLGKAPANILMQEALRRPLLGRVLTLGKQDIWVTMDMLREISVRAGAPLRDMNTIQLSHKAWFAKQGFLSDRSFFELLGFSAVESLDYSNYEGADHIVDLNNQRMPDFLMQRFDFIVDGGTLEHIFHVPNVLNNIFMMLRTGGRILHMAPSSNHMDHGFYMFSPTLFMDFYCANKFEINLSQIYRHTQDHVVDPWEVSEYQPGCLDRVSFGGLDDGIYGVVFLATKTKTSSGSVIPQQGMARQTIKDANLELESPVSLSRQIRRSIGSIPLVRRLWNTVAPTLRKCLIRRKGLGLRVKARY
jgi:hypothetical protein